MASYWDDTKGWVIEGQSLEELREARKPVSEDDLSSLGIIEDNKPQETDNSEETALGQVDKFLDYETRPTGQAYEKLNAWDTTVDVAKAIGNEALHFLQPKQLETQYVERTHLAENLKYMYRYGIGTVGLGKIGWGLKGVKGASVFAKSARVTGTILNPNMVKTENKIIKTLTAGLDNLGAGVVASYVLRNPEEMEGQIMDIFGETDNPIISKLQSNTNDTETQERLKGAINDTIAGIIAAPLFKMALDPLAILGKKIFDNFKVKGEPDPQAVKEAEVAAEEVEKVLDGSDLITKVKETIEQAQSENVEDIERYILDSEWVNHTNKDKVLDIYDIVKNGDEPLPKTDGTFTTQVKTWKDASKVSAEDLKAQTGNDGVELMNSAVKDTWVERGWLAEGEELVTSTETKTGITVKPNTKATNRITKNYTDKFDIKNRVTVEWVDGKVKGSDATTYTRENTGKTDIASKNNQLAIEKKKLQIEKFEERIKKAQSGEKKTKGDNSKLVETLEKQLKIAREELQKLEDKSANKFLLPDIVIQIDKNCANPYAVLRSELEHARDIAKREVPDQSKKHFNRYNGLNESEMSLEYVKKKADKRAGKETTVKNLKSLDNKYDFEDIPYTNTKFDPEEQPMDIIVVKSKTGERLGHIEYDNSILPDTIFIGDMQNYRIETGVGRAAIAKLMQKYPDKKISWVSISEGSTKSYKKFCEEYPDLADKVEFSENITPKEDIDDILNNIYNSEKGVIDEDKIQSSQQSRGSREDIQRAKGESKSDGNLPREQFTDGTTQREYNLSSNINNEPTSQNSIDSNKQKSFNKQSGTRSTTEQPITERINQAGNNLEEVSKVVEEKLANDVPLSGTNWTDLTNDTDKFLKILEEKGITDLTEIKRAFNNGDIDYVNAMTRKALAAEKIIGDLREQAAAMIAKGEDVSEIAETCFYLSNYVKGLGSGAGRTLNEQKVIKKARKFFELTTLEKQGLQSLTDLLSTDLSSLNFTQPLKQLKEEAYTKIQTYFGGNFFNALMTDPALAKAFDEQLTKLLTKKDFKPETIQKALEGLVKKTVKDEFIKGLKGSVNDTVFMKFCSKLGIDNKFLPSMYVTNLLSSPITQFKNIVSGVSNSLYFPFKKMVAGLLGGGQDLAKEGMMTYHFMLGSTQILKESFQMAKQAFKTGEGILINMGKDTPEANSQLENLFTFKPIDSESAKDKFFNVYTVMCRLMGATDEFITQMNYRAIQKAKAFLQAEKGADTLGLKGDVRVKYLEEQTDNLFKQSFDVNGKPLDVESYAEARDIVLQTPLDGKFYDYSLGEKVQIKNQSVTMGLSQALNEAIAKMPMLKLLYPFVRTGANIMQQNLEHNILYGICSPSQQKLLLSQTREGAIARSQLATGLMSFSVASAFVMQGGITGSLPPDKETQQALLKTGWQPYSIRVGNKWVSYQGYEPIQSILGFTADSIAMLQAWDTTNDTTDNLAQFMMLGVRNFVNNFLDKATFRNSTEQLNQIFEIIDSDDPDKWGKAGAKQVKGLLPLSSLGNFVGSITNPEQTKPTGFYENLVNKYFFTGALGDYRRNVFGERQDMYQLFVNRGIEADDSIENQELQRLAELGWSPSELSNKDSTFKYDYRDFKNPNNKRSLHDLFLETQSTITLEGKTLREALAELFESDDYQIMLDGIEVEDLGTTNTRINHIKAIFKRYREAAKEEVIREYGEDYTNKNGNTAAEEQQMIREAQEEKLLEAEVESDIENIRSFGQ